MALEPVAVGKTDVEKRRMFCAENLGIDNEHKHDQRARFKIQKTLRLSLVT
jgi:hypothetical protein